MRGIKNEKSKRIVLTISYAKEGAGFAIAIPMYIAWSEKPIKNEKNYFLIDLISFFIEPFPNIFILRNTAATVTQYNIIIIQRNTRFVMYTSLG